MPDESTLALLLAYWEKCMNVAAAEVAVWRMDNAARIAAAETLPHAERVAAYTELLREALAPVVGAMDAVDKLFHRLH